jgi:hypothetical protein
MSLWTGEESLDRRQALGLLQISGTWTGPRRDPGLEGFGLDTRPCARTRPWDRYNVLNKRQDLGDKPLRTRQALGVDTAL